MARELNGWLDNYLKYTENTESPTSYHIWCALSVIAGALQRRVYLRWGLGQVIYPNIYVVLIGAAGKTRKGVAIGIAKDFLKRVPGVTVTPESSSGRQAMIQAMKRAGSSFTDPTDNNIKFHCAVTAFSEELSVFLGQGDIAYLASLTDWYDSKDDWEYETVSRGKDSLQGLCLTFCGGTAPDWIQSMLPAEAIGGGFTSRIIFVVEDKKKHIVPEYEMDEAAIELGEKLMRDLERIGNLRGAMTFTDTAKELYKKWYVTETHKLDNGQPAVDDSRFASYCERRATHLRKLMMICSASRGDDLKISDEDFYKAKGLLEDVEVNMGRTFGGFGKSRTSDEVELVMNFIKEQGTTTRKMLLTKYFRDLEGPALTAAEVTLQQMGVIKIKLIPEQGDKLYQWVGG